MTVRAPGKLVLIGEYAVLDGSPAVVCAVDRGVQCDVEPADTLSWQTPGDDRFVRAALTAAEAAPGRYVFRAYNAPGTTTKVGFGHSAAATCAAIAAAGVEDGYPLARQVHHEVQGSGSGIDVAASWFGGVLRFQNGVATELPAVRPVVVWSGQSAKTGPRVEQYRSWPRRSSFVRESARLVDGFSDAPVEATRQARRLLEAMAASAGIDYATPELTVICDLAETHGGAAKPSGAGGGDCAVALFDNPDDEAAFRAAVAATELTVIDVNIAPGVHP